MSESRITTADEMCEALLSLVDKGLVVPVWCEEDGDIGWWPASEAPADVTPLTADEVRAHFARIGPELMSDWN